MFQKEILIDELPIIEWCLHERCYNKCSFCFHRTKLEDVNIDKILTTLIPELQRKKYKDVQLEILGGELFSKEESKKTIISTIDMIDKLSNNGFSVKRVRVISNFINIDENGFYELLSILKNKNIEYKISSSFDMIGRFHTINDMNNMINWYRKLQKDFLKVSVVLHKPNIEYMLKNWNNDNDIMKFLDEVHNNGHLSFDYYFPNYKVAVPEKELMSTFLIKCLTRFPKCSTITNIVEKSVRHCSCEDSIPVWNNKVVSCIKVSNIDDNRTLQEAIDEYQNKNNCLICEHYNICSQICYGTSIGKEPDCFLKDVYDYIKRMNND